MNTFLRAGLGALLGVTLLWGSALAIEYEEIFEMTAAGASDEAIIRAIVDDGRGFELSDEEIDDLRTAGVSENVIVAMQDPLAGEQWLEDNFPDPEVAPVPDAGGAPMTQDDYLSALDEAYKQGYEDGRTSLVYSFGYYYGPLSLYYYNDPFYFSFWWGGYPCSYWPSFYAYSYRPYYGWCSPYPYNYYTYSSYYCHSYYDPGYWVAQGYTVQPGYGRTIYDDGPRWRDGGITPPKGGRPEDVQVAGLLRNDGTVTRNRDVSGTQAIRDAGGSTVRQPGTRSVREPVVSSEPSTEATPGTRRSTLRSPEAGTRGGVIRNTPDSETLDRRVVRGSDNPRSRRMRDVASGSRIIRGNQVSEPDAGGRGTRVGRQAGLERSYQRGQRGRESARGEDRIQRRGATRDDAVRIIRGGGRDGSISRGGRSGGARTMGDVVRRGGGSGERGGARLAAPGRGAQGRGGGSGKSAPAPQVRNGGGGQGRGGGAPVAQSRGGGGGGGGAHGRGASMGRGGGGGRGR